MQVAVEEFQDAIGDRTHFTDVRDLITSWQAAGGKASVDVSVIPELSREEIAARVMILQADGDDFRYRQVGESVVALFGHDPTGRRHSDIPGPGPIAFAPIYRRTVQGDQALLAVQDRIGYGTVGSTERLILPVRVDGHPGLAIYLRPREDAIDILRSIFNVSADSIMVLDAVYDGAEIADFVVVAANIEAGRRMRKAQSDMIGLSSLRQWPEILPSGIFDRMRRAVATQSPDVFDAKQGKEYGRSTELQLRLAPHRGGITVTAVDLSPMMSATRAIERHRNELMEANELLERRAVDLTASYQSLERSAQELREEIARNRQLEAELVRMARIDGLTGLCNRSFFEETFEELLRQGRRKHRRIALCTIDLDHFKDINDSLGHSAGDHVLQEVAQRLTGVLRKTDVIGRLGGDEFAVLLSDALDVDDAHTVVDRMIQAVARPLRIGRQSIPIELSVGVSLFPDDGRTTGELMANADIALYRAKRAGRARSVFFTHAMREETERRFKLLAQLREAVEAGEVVPYYQPIIDLRSGRIAGFEALARWQHPERGVLSPAAFGDALIDTDVAPAITRQMLSQIVRDLSGWDPCVVPARVNVNVTAADLRQASFARDLLELVRAHRLDTSRFIIEVTETTILSRESERIRETLNELSALGFRIALDDFGTGYASLSHLKDLPVNTLKIDRSFIMDLDRDPKTAAIVRSIVALAEPLQLRIVAEGIETDSQLHAVQAFGCQFGQGYFISPAIPASAVPNFIMGFRNTTLNVDAA